MAGDATLKTRLTERFGLDAPVISAPMALAAGGRLAAAVSGAGGLGLIGGGYGDAEWLEREFAAAGNARVGCGFITWSLARNPGLLDRVLDRAPAAIFLSFGDPAPFAAKIRDAGVPLICQVQTLTDARHAIDAGAAVIVAQGAEAGGHGERRATFTLVPEIADIIAARAPEILLCAAGGVGDGRGLAAALMLGADGVLVGSRFWASDEALVHPAMHAAALRASGDDTIRSSVMDIVRRRDWPARYTARVLKNRFTERWHGREDALREAAGEADRWNRAWAEGDTDTANTFVGEVTGMIGDIRPAADVLHAIVAEAAELLQRAPRYLGPHR
ncbi:MAG: NAD(P)H-dependent flavin oxidoreductase [Paracoccaceae bacterium]